MLKKSIVAFILFFIGYTVLIVQYPAWGRTANQNTQNIVRAQKYMYRENKKDKTIIGSSLTLRLTATEIPEYSIFGFGGLSAMDAINVMRHKSKLPETIFIEANMLHRGKSNEFSDALFSPIPFYSKKYFPSLRDDKKPFALAELFISKVVVDNMGNKTDKSLATAPASESSTTEELLNSQAEKLKISLEASKKNYSTLYDADKLEKQLLQLEEHVEYFQSQGVNVVFFEMPMHADMMEAPLIVQTREAVLSHFPQDEYTYIGVPQDFTPVTTDGIHLRPDEAKEYTAYFETEAEKIIMNNNLE